VKPRRGTMPIHSRTETTIRFEGLPSNRRLACATTLLLLAYAAALYGLASGDLAALGAGLALDAAALRVLMQRRRL